MYHKQRISEKKRIQRETQNEVENSVQSTKKFLKGQKSTTQTTTKKYQALTVSRQTTNSSWGTHTNKSRKILKSFQPHQNQKRSVPQHKCKNTKVLNNRIQLCSKSNTPWPKGILLCKARATVFTIKIPLKEACLHQYIEGEKLIISIRLHKIKIKINQLSQQNLKIFNWTHQKNTHINSFSYISKIQQENNMKTMPCIKT